MSTKRKRYKLLIRSVFWIIYLLSGFTLYSNAIVIPIFIVNFLKLIYPLSIFWIQIRLNKKEKWFSIDQTMSTSQLWFSIIPVLASLITVILSITNFILVLITKI